MAGAPEEQAAAGLTRRAKSRCPPAGRTGAPDFSSALRGIFLFPPCLADGGLFKLDVEILN